MEYIASVGKITELQLILREELLETNILLTSVNDEKERTCGGSEPQCILGGRAGSHITGF
jgi:hypothetical protein